MEATVTKNNFCLQHKDQKGDRSNDTSTEQKGTDESHQTTFQINRASKNIELANHIFNGISQSGRTYQDVFKALQEKLSQTPLKLKHSFVQSKPGVIQYQN